MIYSYEKLLNSSHAAARRRIIVGSGGFDPLHPGHVEYLRAIEFLPASMHIIGLNSDRWLQNKKGAYFLDLDGRKKMVEAVVQPSTVAWEMDDDAGNSCKFLQHLRANFPEREIVFAKGGDRDAQNIPEISVEGVNFVFDVGGGADLKKYSSSALLHNFYEQAHTKVGEIQPQIVDRKWGWYEVYKEISGLNQEVKVKELVLMPGQSTSIQHHKFRSEVLFAARGSFAFIEYAKSTFELRQPKDDETTTHYVHEGEMCIVHKNNWHQLFNPGNEEIVIVEIQCGEKCEEEDIERKDSWS